MRAALEGAARDMTTLHVRPDQLRTAVEPYPSIMAVDAQADFPHGLRIVVHEHVAVAALAAGSDRVPVAADGTLLRGSSTGGLPVVAVAAPPPGDTLSDERTLRIVTLLAAAPPELRAKVSRVYAGPRGLTAPLDAGPDPLLRRRRPPAREVDGGRPRARRPQLGGRHLPRSAPARAPRRGRPRGPDAGASPSSRRRAGRRSARSPRSPRPAPASPDPAGGTMT